MSRPENLVLFPLSQDGYPAWKNRSRADIHAALRAKFVTNPGAVDGSNISTMGMSFSTRKTMDSVWSIGLKPTYLGLIGWVMLKRSSCNLDATQRRLVDQNCLRLYAASTSGIQVERKNVCNWKTDIWAMLFSGALVKAPHTRQSPIDTRGRNLYSRLVRLTWSQLSSFGDGFL